MYCRNSGDVFEENHQSVRPFIHEEGEAMPQSFVFERRGTEEDSSIGERLRSAASRRRE